MALSSKIYALVLAGGAGTRFGAGVPKQYTYLGGKPLIRWSVETLLHHPRVHGVCVVRGEDHAKLYEKALGDLPLLPPVVGGETRQISVRKGLEGLPPCDIVLIHDSARPYVSAEQITAVIQALDKEHKGVILALPVTDTLKQVRDGEIIGTVDRRSLWQAQTPQVFCYSTILKAHQSLKDRTDLTDDAALFEILGLPVKVIKGTKGNRKITEEDDVKSVIPDVRVGHGFDVHQLKEGSGIWLCGIFLNVPFQLVGHSDADVALHSLTDALLGTIGDGDIGTHFSPLEGKWKGVASCHFLQVALEKVQAAGGILRHADVTLIGEQPRISPYRADLQNHLATLLNLEVNRVSLKATTTEKMGFLGRQEGLAAMATVTVIFDHG